IAERVLEAEAIMRGDAVVFDLSTPGRYELEEEVEGFSVRVLWELTGFLFTASILGSDGLVFAVDARSGEPLAGAAVSVRHGGGTLDGTTGSDGLFTFRAAPPLAVTVAKDGEIRGAFVDAGDPPPAGPLVYVTTDRPTYRPGQTVHFKAVRRDPAGGGLALPSAKEIRLLVRDPRGRALSSEVVPFSDAGTASGSFALGEETPLGRWTVETDVPEPRDEGFRFDSFLDRDERPACFRRSFSVAAYRKPALTVAVRGAAAAEGRGGARIRVEAWSGGPVADAEVRWEVSRRWPAVRDEAPGFTADPRRWFFERDRQPGESSWWGWEEEHVADGEGETGPDGTLDVSFPIEAEERGSEFVVRAEVTDRTGLFAEGEGVVVRAGAAISLDLHVAAAAAAPGEEIDVVARATGPDGAPLAGRPVELVALRPNVEQEYETCFSARVETDRDGRARFRAPVPEASSLRLKASTPGAPEVRRELEVAWLDPAEVDWFEFSLRPDRYVYETGETARVLVRSTRAPIRGLLVVEGATRHEARVITLEQPAQFLEVPLGPEHAPNVHVRLIAFDGGFEAGDGFELLVFPRERLIEVDVAADHPRYAPREPVRIAVTTRDAAGSPLPAEVELSVVDAALFAVEPDDTPDIRRFFHPLRVHRGADGGDFELPFAGTFRGSDFEGLGFVLFGVAEEGGVSDEPRRYFPDLAFFQAQARTGADGRCEVEFTAPDSLTSWRVLARAVAGPDRLGQGASALVTRKDVSLRLGAPRAFVAGDEGEVVAVLRSDLAAPARFQVRLECTGFGTTEPVGPEREVDLLPGTEVRVPFRVNAVAPGTGTLVIRATSDRGGDAMEVPVPILARGAEDWLAVSGRAEGTLRLTAGLPEGVDPSTARLTLLLTSPAEAVAAALPFLAGYPYGCVEQTMSRFLPAVIAARAGQRLGLGPDATLAELPAMVDKGLQRLYGYQHEDGGWGWWKDDDTRAGMTAYVVLGLAAARDAGFPVDAATLRAAVGCLREMESTPEILLARSAAGDAAEDLAAAAPKSDEARAILVLAGRRDLAGGLPATPPAEDGPEAVRAAALILRALHAANPADPRRAVFTEWLLARRRGHGWYSTLDTAHVVRALAETADPGPARRAALAVNGRPLDPTDCLVEVPAECLRAGSNEIVVEGQGLFATAILLWREPATDLLAERPGSFEVERWFEQASAGEDVPPTASRFERGARVRMVVRMTALSDQEFVLLECPFPAGLEPAPADPEEEYGDSEVRREVRDDRVCVALTSVERDGEYEFAFDFVAIFPGTWHALPASAFAMYRPDARGRSAESLFRIE
ncbi:MAG: MG2 domain-containing protein, partial [Planctomycetes bacterium]|nr:MG2 domain-containing protein [Planctomycetota bacterium]